MTKINLKPSESSNVILRHITPDDFDSLRSLYTLSLKNNAQGFIQDLAFHGDIAERALGYQKNKGAMLGAFDAEALIGCGALCKRSDDRVELGKLHLHPDYQGKGIGRKMAEELITHARKLDYKILELHVTVTQTAALGLYKRLGFVETRREVFTHTDGASYDTVFMDLVL